MLSLSHIVNYFKKQTWLLYLRIFRKVPLSLLTRCQKSMTIIETLLELRIAQVPDPLSFSPTPITNFLGRFQPNVRSRVLLPSQAYTFHVQTTTLLFGMSSELRAKRLRNPTHNPSVRRSMLQSLAKLQALSLDSSTFANPAGSGPVVGIRRRPELESDVGTTPWSRLQLCLGHSERVASDVDHVTDVLLQRQRQRQSVDASSAPTHQVSRDCSSTTILQARETAHAGDQRHLRLRCCISKHQALITQL